MIFTLESKTVPDRGCGKASYSKSLVAKWERKGGETRIGKQGVLELTQRVAWITSVAEPRAARVALVGRGRPGHFRGPLVA